MFDVPEAKRVRRSELFTNSPPPFQQSSRAASPPGAHHKPDASALNFEFDYDLKPAPNLADLTNADEPTTYQFRLFTSAPNQAITIRSPTPPASSTDGRFINPYRPRDYYFTDADTLESKRRERYVASAVSGDMVLSFAERAWPGTTLPGRVIHLPSTTKTPSVAKPKLPTTSKSKPNKKRRILLRTLHAMTFSTQKSKQAADEADRAKRTARNRMKKVKKKVRQKAKKTEAGTEVGERL